MDKEKIKEALEKREGVDVSSLTPKGCAMLAAIDAGFLPKVEGGRGDELFNRFWEIYTKNLGQVSMKKTRKTCNDSWPIVNNKPADNCGYCPECHHIKSIRRTLRLCFFLISFLFGAFFTHITLVLFQR